MKYKLLKTFAFVCGGLALLTCGCDLKGDKADKLAERGVDEIVTIGSDYIEVDKYLENGKIEEAKNLLHQRLGENSRKLSEMKGLLYPLELSDDSRKALEEKIDKQVNKIDAYLQPQNK